jgi:hypothetical protein
MDRDGVAPFHAIDRNRTVHQIEPFRLDNEGFPQGHVSQEFGPLRSDAVGVNVFSSEGLHPRELHYAFDFAVVPGFSPEHTPPTRAKPWTFGSSRSETWDPLALFDDPYTR